MNIFEEDVCDKYTCLIHKFYIKAGIVTIGERP